MNWEIRMSQFIPETAATMSFWSKFCELHNILMSVQPRAEDLSIIHSPVDWLTADVSLLVWCDNTSMVNQQNDFNVIDYHFRD